jgi:hypothetical protein
MSKNTTETNSLLCLINIDWLANKQARCRDTTEPGEYNSLFVATLPLSDHGRGSSDSAPTGNSLPVQSSLRTGNVATESECGLWGGMNSWRFRTRREVMNRNPCGLSTEPAAETIRR